MKKPIYYYLLGIIAVIGIIVLIFVLNLLRYLPWGNLSDENPYKVVRTFTSPDSQYVATLYTSMGGGAAGWCHQCIEINKKDSPFDLERLKSEFNAVFTVSCGSELEIKWLESGQLNIAYTVDIHGVHIYQTFQSRDKLVKISYTPKNLVAP
jgi:hypothetical protein